MSKQRSQHTVGNREVHQGPSLHEWFPKSGVFHVRIHGSVGVGGSGTCDVDVCSCVCGVLVGAWNVRVRECLSARLYV